jgi:hypothetical protein
MFYSGGAWAVGIGRYARCCLFVIFLDLKNELWYKLRHLFAFGYEGGMDRA